MSFKKSILKDVKALCDDLGGGQGGELAVSGFKKLLKGYEDEHPAKKANGYEMFMIGLDVLIGQHFPASKQTSLQRQATEHAEALADAVIVSPDGLLKLASLNDLMSGMYDAMTLGAIESGSLYGMLHFILEDHIGPTKIPTLNELTRPIYIIAFLDAFDEITVALGMAQNGSDD